MIYIKNNDNRPQYNLALEEYVFTQLEQFDEIFLLWINEPSIIVGKNQNTIEEINLDYTKENNIHVVRRLSGGGAVYHDLGNLNYTITSKGNNTVAFNFEEFTKPVLEVLSELGVEAKFTGRNDIVIGEQKFCGNAQYMSKDKVLHHGAMLFDVDLTVLTNALKVSKDKIESKGIKSVRSRVTNIIEHLEDKITVEDFKELLLNHMMEIYDIEEYILTDEDKKNIEKLMDERYNTWEWNFGSSPEFNIHKAERFTGGKVETKIDVDGGIIKNIKFYGDFFGVKDITDIENKLEGIKYKEEDIKATLSEIDLPSYFARITEEEILKIII